MKHNTSAPSNIALIKYMGKTSQEENLPGNISLSYTLENLRCFVELELSDAAEDTYEPLIHKENYDNLPLSEAGKTRFLHHLKRLKTFFQIEENFIVRSALNFPMNTGLASSAASFAALTRCACELFSELKKVPMPDTLIQAQLSRQGSGSSCRSFYSPWCVWENDKVYPIDLPYQNLIHRVILVETESKLVSSSQAHQRVTTSLLFSQRPNRAQTRYNLLVPALQEKNWQLAYEIVWQEFWDMHALFETTSPPFHYLQPKSLAALNHLRYLWEKHGDGPLVTMDAGANIHLLFRPDQKEFMETDYQGFLPFTSFN